MFFLLYIPFLIAITAIIIEYTFFENVFSIFKFVFLLVLNLYNINLFLFSFFFKIGFFFNFFILFFYLFKFFLNCFLILTKFFVFKIFDFFFSLQIFFGQFIMNSDGIWRHASHAIFPHFFNKTVFFILFLCYLILMFVFFYQQEEIKIDLIKDLGNVYFGRELMDALAYHGRDPFGYFTTENIVSIEEWCEFINDPYLIFNYEDPEIEKFLQINLVSSLIEHQNLSIINNSNLYLNFDIGKNLNNNFIFKTVKQILLYFFKNFIHFENSWKLLIDLFFCWIYFPCLIYVVIKLLFFKWKYRKKN